MHHHIPPMSVQLPYNPHPPGAAPIPVWVPPYTHNPPGRQHIVFPFADVTWTALGPRHYQKPFTASSAAFHHFKKLPPELRFRIWAFAAPERVLELRSWGNGDAPVKVSVHPHRLPSLFRTCHESRIVALRIYRITKVGLSFAVKDPTKRYIDWKLHPRNEASRIPAGRAPLSPSLFDLSAEPYEPQVVRVSWERDIIYFGPDFQREHLGKFFKGQGAGMELRGLERVAISKTLWCGREDERNVIREILWRLIDRDVREVIIVPDDAKGPLIDRWYYGKHDIELLDPEWSYTFRHNGALMNSKGVVENLEEWFSRLWKTDVHLPGDSTQRLEAAETVRAQYCKEPPAVMVKSIRRDGRRMSAFKDGLWDIQNQLGDMQVWRNWNPPERS